MAFVMLVGRIVFALFFLDNGVNNLRTRPAMAKRLAAPTMPALIRRYPDLFNIASSLLLVAGSVMLAVGAWADVGALFLVAFLVPTTLTSHPYWTFTDPAQRRQQRMSFLRNVTFLGGCLFLFGFFAAYGHGLAYTLTDALFDLR